MRFQIAHLGAEKGSRGGIPLPRPESFGSQPQCWEGADRQRLPIGDGRQNQHERAPKSTNHLRHCTYHSILYARTRLPTSTAVTMFSAARTLSLTRSVAGRRLFHASAPAFVKVGDKLPDVDLVEGSPGNKVNLAKELTGKGVIIGISKSSRDFIHV